MAQDAVPAANAIVSFIKYSKYNRYKTNMPKQFSSNDSNLLRELQVRAINAGAVSKVKRDTIVNMAAWTTKGQPCVHVSFRPILRDNLNYSAFLPLSLVEKCGHVVAGVCVTSLDHYRHLDQHIKSLSLSLDNILGSLLERLWLRLENNVNHDSR
ncbi:hypothetical protein COCVIDRAFT_40750 [Bipolaris victoriae FI3]|uniref:Uncharacterized protein n=1 Tax=Bipolaris victoriae (strain FI3) TaxID=930091 RepID=W7E658_BIPV3|nr:hypothetical protein COCVIDRAFT_40750 [Bipolaris victoriae FI3]